MPHEIGAAEDERSAEVQLTWPLTWLMEAMEHFARLEAEARERIASTERRRTAPQLQRPARIRRPVGNMAPGGGG